MSVCSASPEESGRSAAERSEDEGEDAATERAANSSIAPHHSTAMHRQLLSLIVKMYAEE